MQLKISNLAFKELEKIQKYIWIEFGEHYANKFLNTVHNKFLKLLDNPEMTPVVYEKKGIKVRRLVVNMSVVFYVAMENTVYILLICDSRRSPRQIKQEMLQELNKL